MITFISAVIGGLIGWFHLVHLSFFEIAAIVMICLLFGKISSIQGVVEDIRSDMYIKEDDCYEYEDD